tara:strand:+ start:1365 stop:2327 length:963 start_codon:yes stop_codon:yes gene_type:complete
MAEFDKDEYKFPDEIDNKKVTIEADGDLEIEIEDDTPEEDRNRTPADPAKVRKLEVEVDDLDKYSKDAKDKMIQMKRVWNDERRRAESAERERQAAIEAAQRLMAENNRMKNMLVAGEGEFKEAVTNSAKAQLTSAKQAYKNAYEAGDVDKVMEAQEELTRAQLEVERANRFKLPPLQEEKFDVQSQPEYQAVPRPDEKVMAWQRQNPWFGQDEEMTAAALGLHEKLKRQGVVIGSDDYYAKLDTTMRKRFSENFEEDLEPDVNVRRADSPRTKSPTVVASASRSTAPKRVRLTQSQVAISKKLGLTPEQYVRELLKMEA